MQTERLPHHSGIQIDQTLHIDLFSHFIKLRIYFRLSFFRFFRIYSHLTFPKLYKFARLPTKPGANACELYQRIISLEKYLQAYHPDSDE